MPAHRAFRQKWRNFQRRVRLCRRRLPTGTSFNHPEYKLQGTGRTHASHKSRRRLLSSKSLSKRSGSVRGNDLTIFFSRRRRQKREDRMEWWGKILQKATRPEQKHKCDSKECKTNEWKINSNKIKKRRRWFASKKMTNKESNYFKSKSRRKCWQKNSFLTKNVPTNRCTCKARRQKKPSTASSNYGVSKWRTSCSASERNRKPK